MRYLLALLVVLSLQLVPGSVEAATRVEAKATCLTDLNWRQNSTGDDYGCVDQYPADATSGSIRSCELRSGYEHGGYYADSVSTVCSDVKSIFSWSGSGCDGSTWNLESGMCNPSPAECLAKEPLGSAFVSSVTSSTCNDGCEYKAVTDTVSGTIAGVGSVTTVTGWEPTGSLCAAGTPEPENLGDPQVCIAAGVDGAGRAYTACIKADGQHCYTASSGKQICWRPGETGEKADGDTLQKRNVGDTAIAPTTPPPPGGTLTPQHSTTMTTQVGGSVFNTTTTNYETGGAEVAPDMPGAGESDDGTGSPTGDGGEDSGSVTGGVDCETPPVVQGDPILANIVLQTWGTRCAAESQNAVKATGNIEDCESAFTVTGPADDPNVSKLKGIRAEICGSYGDGDGDGQPDWTQGDAPAVPGAGEPEPGGEPGPPSQLEVGTGLLDMDGFLGGAATCPTLGVIDFGSLGTFDLDSLPMWCDLIAIMRAIVLMMAAFTAIKILMGGN